MKNKICLVVGLYSVLMASLSELSSTAAPLLPNLVFCCRSDNDLYRAITAGGKTSPRYDKPTEAIAVATERAGVLLLADGYPQTPTRLDAGLFQQAARKKLRLYVEYPAFLPAVELGKPRETKWERGVVASDVFAPTLPRLHILAIHGCRFMPLRVEISHVVMARVAGFDTAVYGLPKESFPILCELPKRDDVGEVLVATTKLSQCVTARLCPNRCLAGNLGLHSPLA